MANKRQSKKNSKQTPIKRITKAQEAEFKKLQKNALAKVNRLHKTKGEQLVIGMMNKQGEMLYDAVNPDYFKQRLQLNKKITDFKTWEDLHAWQENAKRFTKRAVKQFQFKKNSEGVVASEAVLNRAKRNNKREIENATKEIMGKLDQPIFNKKGVQISTFREEIPKMGTPSYGGIKIPVVFDFNNQPNVKRMIDKLRIMERRSQDDYLDWRAGIYKQNFITKMEKTFNSDADLIVEFLNHMDNRDFFDLAQQYKEILNIEVYSSEGNENNTEEQLNKIISYLTAYGEGKLMLDLRDFPSR